MRTIFDGTTNFVARVRPSLYETFRAYAKTTKMKCECAVFGEDGLIRVEVVPVAGTTMGEIVWFMENFNRQTLKA